MFTFKNAVKNIYRYKNKYILFCVLYFIIISAFSICINIFVKMNQVINDITKEYAGIVRYAGKVYIDFNNENAAPLRFTKDEFLKFKDINHIDDIKYFRYNFYAYTQKNLPADIMITNIKNYPAAIKTQLYIDGEVITLGYGLSPAFIVGYNMSHLHLVSDRFNLESGRMFENDNEAVIAKNRLDPNFIEWDENTKTQIELKDWKDLELGDRISINNNEGLYKEFTIVGILEQNRNDNPMTNREILYTTLESAEYFDIIADDKEIKYQVNEIIPKFDDRDVMFMQGYEVLIYLDNPKNFEIVRKKMNDIDLNIEPFFPNYNAIAGLTYNMKTWSMLFMIVTAFIIIIVAIISTLILLNSRKYEIAVLLSCGMKKSRLVISYLIENLAFIWGISIISVVAAQFISKIFTERVFSGMRNLMSAENFESLVKGVNIELIPQNIGLVFAGTTAVVMLSLILAGINILRLEPLKIFNKQY